MLLWSIIETGGGGMGLFHKKGRRARIIVEPPVPRRFRGIVALAEKIEPWLPWAVAGLVLAAMGYLTLRYHTVGGFGVETDFYAELYPPARDLLNGHFSPLNYSAKGPVYSILLAGTYLVVRDFFTAGLVLNLLCASAFLAAAYFLVKTVFNTLTAAVVLIAAATNLLFLSHVYQAGSDIPFMLLCALSMYFLFRDRGAADLILSAVCALLAFLTRYNGAFLVAGAVLYYTASEGTLKERAARSLLWLGVFAAAGLPWFIPNWIATGSPVKNSNYVNVMMDFYALGKGANYERWTDALPKQFTGMTDIFLYDPWYFIRHFAGNIVSHFIGDMKELVGWGAGVFVFPGALLFTVVRPVRGRLLYLAFGFFYFMILALVFYNPRFSLFLLVMYLPLAVWPLTLPIHPPYFRWATGALLIAFIVVTGLSTPGTFGRVNREVRNSPVFLKELGQALGSEEPDKTQKLTARKPHTAYYAGLQPIMFPNEPGTVGDLVVWCRANGVRYILYSAIEAQLRPNLMDLARLGEDHPGLKEVYHNRYGVIYRVE
jgi:hypothetical protein